MADDTKRDVDLTRDLDDEAAEDLARTLERNDSSDSE